MLRQKKQGAISKTVITSFWKSVFNLFMLLVNGLQIRWQTYDRLEYLVFLSNSWHYVEFCLYYSTEELLQTAM